MSGGQVREQVPEVLYRLVEESDELQRTAGDADAVSKLAAFLQDDSCSVQLKVGPGFYGLGF